MRTMMLFGLIFAGAGVLVMLLPVLAPHLQGSNPGWMSVLFGMLFVAVGAGAIQIQRAPQSVPLWGGLMAAAVGAFIVVMAGYDPDESRFSAPRWVVGAAGATFLLGGVAAVMTRGDQHAPVQHSLKYGFILALLFTCFGAVASWVAFGPGEREFKGSLEAGGDVMPLNVGELLGRLLFSPAALLLDVMALAAWVFLLRALLRRRQNAVEELPAPKRRSRRK